MNLVSLPINPRTISDGGPAVDVIIIEDDPYYFLQMPQYAPKGIRITRASPFDRDADNYLRSLVPSYLKWVKPSTPALECADHVTGSTVRGE